MRSFKFIGMIQLKIHSLSFQGPQHHNYISLFIIDIACLCPLFFHLNHLTKALSMFLIFSKNQCFIQLIFPSAFISLSLIFAVTFLFSFLLPSKNDLGSTTQVLQFHKQSIVNFSLRFFLRFGPDSSPFLRIQGLCLLHPLGKNICIWSLLSLHLIYTQVSHFQLLCISAIDQNVLWSKYC